MSVTKTVRSGLAATTAIISMGITDAFAGSANDIVGFTNVDVTNPVRGSRYDNNKFFIMDGNKTDYVAYNTTCGPKAVVGYEGNVNGKLVGFAIGVPLPRDANSEDTETRAFGSAKVDVNAGVYATGVQVNPNYLGNIWSSNVQEVRMNLPNDTSCVSGASSTTPGPGPVDPGTPGTPPPPPPPPPPSGGCEPGCGDAGPIVRNTLKSIGMLPPSMA